MYLILLNLKMDLKEEEVREIKEILEDNEKEHLKTLKSKSFMNYVNLASLFVICYNYFKTLTYYVDIELSDKINKILNENEIQDLLYLLDQYGDGNEFGAYYLGEKIKDYANENKEKIEELIEIFFKIFINEDE